MTIIRNRAKCNLCNEIIESEFRHDYVQCKCGAIAVDGGKAYLRRAGQAAHITEMSEFDGEGEDDGELQKGV